jgi:hypothetical protein
MKKIVRGSYCALAAVALTFVGAGSARADVIDPNSGLTLDTDPSLIFGQTAASPCVIGGSSCQNGAFPYTLENGGNAQEFADTSPIYPVASITGLVGTSFTIGLDYNDTSDPQTLKVFTATYCITVGNCTAQTFDVATALKTNNNGVGFSDFLLTGFVIPAGTTTVQFFADWLGNDGPDRYFLIGQNTPGTPVPEPATLSLFGLGLLGLARSVMRRRKQQ